MKLRIATFNAENLFSRPKILTAKSPDVLLGLVAELNQELGQPVFDQVRIAALKKKLSGYITINDVKGKHTSAGIGAGDWLGWVEFTRQRIDDMAIQNTARVLSAINADIFCLCEVESRPVLRHFHDEVLSKGFLKAAGLKDYPYILLIDGNDDRGIDVAVMSRHPIVDVNTHIFDKTNYLGKKVNLYSRDCLEVRFALGPGKELVLLANHFKSLGYSDPADKLSLKRRRGQAAGVAKLLDAYQLDSEYLVVAGDLNSPPHDFGNGANTSLEPLTSHPSLYNACLELPDGERGTHGTGKQQLDYLLISTALQQKLKSVYIERRGAYARSKWTPFPEVTGRKTAASDHSAVVADFNI